MRYTVVIGLIGLAAGACGDEATLHVNVAGTFVAESFDGSPDHTVPLEVRDTQGRVVDTAAVFAISEMRFDLLDQSANPDEWDNATLTQVTTCLTGSEHLDCDTWADGGRMEWSMQHAYLATQDTLYLRNPEFAPDLWARLPWIGDQAAFDLEWGFQADRLVVVRFVRR